MNKFATPEEIQYAHSILLNGKPDFEQDKIDIIECNESQDIKACPGSGKTTTLLAKLIILANRMPLPNNQGICVLTHTNVAIDEIKSKLGNKADILFKYPNHFGTIQSFVDKFLAIPIYKLLWNSSPKRIDNNAAYDQIKKSFLYKKYDEKKCIYSQIKDRIPKSIPAGKKNRDY
jgi:superfamily I DNA/RNA helicase